MSLPKTKIIDPWQHKPVQINVTFQEFNQAYQRLIDHKQTNSSCNSEADYKITMVMIRIKVDLHYTYKCWYYIHEWNWGIFVHVKLNFISEVWCTKLVMFTKGITWSLLQTYIFFVDQIT